MTSIASELQKNLLEKVVEHAGNIVAKLCRQSRVNWKLRIECDRKFSKPITLAKNDRTIQSIFLFFTKNLRRKAKKFPSSSLVFRWNSKRSSLPNNQMTYRYNISQNSLERIWTFYSEGYLSYCGKYQMPVVCGCKKPIFLSCYVSKTLD